VVLTACFTVTAESVEPPGAHRELNGATPLRGRDVSRTESPGQMIRSLSGLTMVSLPSAVYPSTVTTNGWVAKTCVRSQGWAVGVTHCTKRSVNSSWEAAHVAGGIHPLMWSKMDISVPMQRVLGAGLALQLH